MMLEQEGKTVKLVTIDGRFAGIIAVADEGKQSWNAAVTFKKDGNGGHHV